MHLITVAHSPADSSSNQLDEPVWMNPHGFRHICEDSSSQAAFARASEWLAYCVKHDPGCAPPDQNYVPRRLVNVNLGNEALHPFLEEPTAPKKYACLSYCWGLDSDDVLRTTKNNIEAHRSAIPIDSMPASLQDAVKVCRRLDIPYLWVDSLCILQGHRDEWLHDSAKMDLTYLNSHLTIAALEPASCKSGFLGQQLYGIQLNKTDFDKFWSKRWAIDPYSLNSRGWCLQEEVLPNRRLCFNGLEMSWECLCRKVCECGHLIQSNVNTRTLSQASDIVTLGLLLKKPAMTKKLLRNAMAHSEPQSASLSQASDIVTFGLLLGNPAMTKRVYRNTMAHSKPQYAFGKSPSQRFDESTSMTRSREMWRQLVSKYTRRRLSYRRDKLPALQGMTKLTMNAIELEDGCPDQFLAGLWKKEIHFDLAWCVERPRGSSYKLGSHNDTKDTYCGPSWSWVSSDRPIKYDCCQKFWSDLECGQFGRLTGAPYAGQKCEFMGANCITELAEDPTGPVLQARIRLKGSLVAVELGMLETADPGELDNFLTSRYLLENNGSVLVRNKSLRTAWASMDTPINPNIKLEDRTRSCWLNGMCFMTCCSWDDKRQTEFYCFRLFSWQWTPMYPNETWFLLLKISSDGVFRRIGVGYGNTHSLFDCHSTEETIEII
ncbi:hypothetical protein E8E14_010213 [Neopestalotiopsis sp. 37M]|nr:hypothetical protein E8E14_010213 [Neopestalotiopsis sp. 37M]